MKYLQIFFITLLLFTSCNNDDDQPQNPIDQLPPATQTGENTFGCLINGELLIVENTTELTAIYQGGVLQIGGGFEDDVTDIDITINLENPLVIDMQYDLTDFPTYIAKFRKINSEANCSYTFEDTFEGFITITNLDQTNFIVSGLFEFSTTIDSCETVIITEGRFDLQYIP